MDNKFRLAVVLMLFWNIFVRSVVEGQSDCLRTNRQPDRKCVQSCDLSVGCSEPGMECLCDGDCGYSCVPQGLSCDEPPRLANAKANYEGVGFGNTVTYDCNDGYTLSASPTRTCRAIGRWDGVGPNCLKMCVVPEIPFSTYIKEPKDFNRTYATGERITLACKPGFEAKPGGQPVRLCISGGWTRFPFECEGNHSCKRTVRAPRTKCTQECSPESGCSYPNQVCLCDGSCGFSCVEKGMKCGAPPEVENGFRTFTGDGYNATANYSCNDGYSLNTAPVKRCTAKKRWDGLSPRCLQDCPPPTVPKNAIIENPRDKYKSTDKVKFKCNQGYNQEGVETQMCFVGRWTVLPFKCTEGGCGDPGTPEHGRKLGVTYSANSRVYFNCDLGYELVGSELRKCQLNGTWTGIQPKCRVVDCGFPPRPMNGSFTGNETTFQNSLTFECDEGFDLEGTETRMCTSDKNWSGKEVTCTPVNCGVLQTPKHGKQYTPATTYTSKAVFDCDEGYILYGSKVLYCQADREWNEAVPTCQAVDCGPLNPPMNGSSVGDQTTFPSSITLRCDPGFELMGSSTRSCLANATWSGKATVCKAVDCGKLSPPLNGSVSGDLTTFPNQVDIRCDEGFILRGPNQRQCQADKTWSGETTLCEAINCGKPVPPNHGSVFGISTRYPHELHFTCDIGYDVEGPQVRKCQANGTWSGETTVCKPVDCGPLNTPINGTKIGNATTFLHTVRFRCDKGFETIGSASRTCQANKQWSGEETSCKAVDCNLLPVLNNGHRIGKATTFPNSVWFSCHEGFNLFGSSMRTCQANGSWSGEPTLCKAKDCGPLPVLANGSVDGNRTTYPNFVSFSCDEGFLLNGSLIRTCLADGVWSGEDTFCAAVDCGQLQTPKNGSLHGKKTVFPNTLNFTCDSGFILRGSHKRTCRPNGTWNGEETSCEARDCGPLQSPMNGLVVGNESTFPNKVSFSCDNGFILRGSSIRQCQADGTWSGNTTICDAKDCGPLSVPANGSATGKPTTYQNKIVFGCDKGFVMSGSRTRECQSTGVWSGNTTLCSAIDCGFTKAPNNGSKVGEETFYPHQVKLSCDEGFDLLGSTVRWCQANGTWSGQPTACKARDCGLLKVPSNGSSFGEDTTFPNIISFYCDVGFIMIGSQARKCQSNGMWSGNNTVCQAVECGSLAMPRNGSSYGDLTTFPNKVYFQCDKGFDLKGSRLRMCLANGSWSGRNTSCEAVNCGKLPAPRNGSVHGHLTVFPNMMTLSCDPGFILQGASVRTCQENGTWSGKTTVCNPIDCGTLEVPTNGSLYGSKTFFTNVLRFACDAGFILHGSKTKQCLANGTWSGGETYCKAVDCGPLPTLLNGTSSGDLTVFPNYAHFKCDSGFVLIGSSSRMCQANGTWSGATTSCHPVDCGRIHAPQNGTLKGHNTTFPNVQQFYCDEGFLLTGPVVRKCQANGTWSGTEAKCEANDCGRLPAPMNGSLVGHETTYPNKVRFSCAAGFVLRGARVRQCQANWTWSGDEAFCEAVDCGHLNAPLNGSRSGNLTVFPNAMYLACNPGFILGGSSVRTCQANGTWSGSITYCTAIDCGQLQIPYNGSIIGKRTIYPNSLRFECDEGFTLIGSSLRKCRTDGTWSGSKTACQANDCGPISTPKNGSAVGNSTIYPDKVTFECDEGFILKGSRVRQCQANTTWSGNSTFCDAVDCGSLRIPLNGSLVGDLTVFPNAVQFACDTGFGLHGSSSRTCQAGGNWSGNETTCRAVDCGPISAPQNGSQIGEWTTYPNVLQFHCDQGFTLLGSATRKCQANGTWAGTASICEANDCGPIPVPRNGSLIGNLTTYPNKVTFICDEGFILRGSNTRQCQADKSWSGNTSYCDAVDCGPLPIPLNGSSSGNETIFPNDMQFSCAPGFILVGSSVRRCQSNGIWSGNKTVCIAVDCGALHAPQNGTIQGELTTYPNKLVFECHKGFTIYGSSIRECQTDGTWSGTDTFCSANDCGPLAVPLNGTLIGNQTTYTSKVMFACDEGFILKGSVVRQCEADRSWSGNKTTCEAKDCGSLAVPSNGSLSGTRTTYPNHIMFDCEEGFILKGSKIRTCQSNGRWSGNTTICEAKDCGPLGVPLNGSLVGNQTTYPHQVKFVCDKGFNLRGSRVRQCLSNGTWSGQKTYCEAQDCGPLLAPMNGSLVGDKVTYPNDVNFYCDIGFVLKGSERRQCQANGTWSGRRVSCIAKDCGRLSKPVNGSSVGNQTTFPNKISFQCDEGFILRGSDTRVCQASGVWSGDNTICEAVDCGSLAVPLNGSMHGNLTVYPNNIQFTCEPGFILSGSSYRTCQASGIWDGNETFCEAVDCGQLIAPQNGSVRGKGTKYPTVLRFRCDDGFILGGSFVTECTTNGTWSGNDARCHAEDCGPLPVPRNGSRLGNRTTFPNSVHFTCDEGFHLRGSNVRRCQANGTWSGKQTSCEAIDCGPLAVPINGSSSGNLTLFPNSIYFSCDSGFIIAGSGIRTCQPNGTWSGNQVTCSAVDCGQPQSPVNGGVIGNITVYPHTMLLTCDEGFDLRGFSEVRCQANGTWSRTSSFCEAKDCGRISAPQNGSYLGNKTTFPHEVIFRCDDGFNLKGPEVRRCLADGTWSGNRSLCEAVDCGPLPVPWNGSLSGYMSVFPNSVYLSCDSGFVLSGSSVRTCQANGTWSGTNTNCFPRDCGEPKVAQNGSVTGESTVFPNTQTYNCDLGFLLRGPRVIKCQANGTWSSNNTHCEAKDCGFLSAPLNGSHVGNKTTFPNEIRFSCDEGFNLMGSSVRRCQSDGRWSGSETRCAARDCGPLARPMNGFKYGNSTTYRNTVHFACEKGYTLKGSASRTCNASGFWDGEIVVCQAVDCGALEAPVYGSVHGEKTTFPNRLIFSCNPGYDVFIGTLVRVCQANGSWSGSQLSCKPKDCGSLPAPQNGVVSGSKTSYSSKLKFECDVGFELQGSATRICQENGRWSGTETTCTAVDCGPLSTPENGFIVGNSTTYPNLVSFRCNEGFFLKGPQTRMCQADGTWSGEDVLCRGMNCGLLPPPVNGWLFGSKTTHPSRVFFTCKKGYRLLGPSQRMCMQNGSWSDKQPRCAAEWCSQPPEVPPYAYRTWGAAKQRYEHGERIFYSCKSGFVMVGIPVQDCVMGKWTDLSFNCSAPSCEAPLVPKYAYITFPRGHKGRHLRGEKVYYSCQTGYHLVGIPEIECLQGVWTSAHFKCDAVSCGYLQTPANGIILRNTGITFKQRYEFKCNDDKGFLMRGSASRQCLANGTWSGVQPVCYLQSCPSPGEPVNGKALSESRSKLFFGDVVDFKCDYGYTARGHEKTRCQIDGSWSSRTPSCVKCSLPLGLKNRMIFNHQLSASSERDSRHGAKHGRLHGGSAWCSARSSFPKYLQIDFGLTMEITAVATQGHPRDYKWVTKYVLKYSLGKHWLTYQESGEDKVFKGNKDRNTVVKHDLKERLVAKRVRLLRYQNSQDFMGSTACLRAEVYGCEFESSCITVGSMVFARWNSVRRNSRFFHGYIIKVRSTSVDVSPSGNHGANLDSIVELPRAGKLLVIPDRIAKPSEISIGSDVAVSAKDGYGFSSGKVTKKFATWYGVQVFRNEIVWGRVNDIRVLKSPIYCDSY